MRVAVEADQQWIANLEVEEKAREFHTWKSVLITFGYYISISRKADRSR